MVAAVVHLAVNKHNTNFGKVLNESGTWQTALQISAGQHTLSFTLHHICAICFHRFQRLWAYALLLIPTFWALDIESMSLFQYKRPLGQANLNTPFKHYSIQPQAANSFFMLWIYPELYAFLNNSLALKRHCNWTKRRYMLSLHAA